MKNTIWYLILGSIFVLAYSPSSNAAGPEVIVYPAGDNYRSDHRYQRRDQHAPRWMNNDREFWRWYDRSHHRDDRFMVWSRLFEIYLHERHHDRSYRKYDRHSKKHYRKHRGRDKYNRGGHRRDSRRGHDDRRRYSH